MGRDFNLYVKNDFPYPDNCIYGIYIDSCISESIINLIFQRIPNDSWIYDEWGDPYLCILYKKDFVMFRELLLYSNTSEYQQEIALQQLDDIIENISNKDRLILESC